VEIFRSRPKFGIILDIVRDVGHRARQPAHTVEADAALRDVLLHTVEREPEAVAVVGSAARKVERKRIDRRILTESDIAGNRSKLQRLRIVERNARPLVRSLDQAFRAHEEVFRQNVGGFLGRAIVKEGLRVEVASGGHESVPADHAEHTVKERHAASAIVAIDKRDLRHDSAKVRTGRAVVLVPQRDEMLRVLGRALAGINLPSIHNEPAASVERIEVFLGRNKLVAVAPRFVRGGGEERGDGGLEIGEVAHDGVDSSKLSVGF